MERTDELACLCVVHIELTGASEAFLEENVGELRFSWTQHLMARKTYTRRHLVGNAGPLAKGQRDLFARPLLVLDVLEDLPRSVCPFGPSETHSGRVVGHVGDLELTKGHDPALGGYGSHV
jgi:hypothetical protein